MELKGVHTVKKRLASGETRTYYYAWRGGPQIKETYGSPAFHVAYVEAHKERKKAPPGTLFTLVAEFRASAEYKLLADSTKRAYGAYLKDIEEEFGDMPLAALSDPGVRGDFKAWRDKFAETPRKADYAWTTLARVLSVAKDRGRIPVNPCERGGRLYDADRNEAIWTEDHIAKLIAVSGKHIIDVLLMALWTGQRQGDLLRLTWSAYNGTHIKLRQSKTGRRLRIPVGVELKKRLDAMKRQSPIILTNSHGAPWTSDGFRTSWWKACDAASIDGLTFHDLRGSAVTRLALAGASVPEIAAFTGLSLKDVEQILDRHYLGRDQQLAESAVRKLETRTKTVNRRVNRSRRSGSGPT
ncbi:MAG: tyrosine-type recombinase/integrase [Rhizobiales bacterium]|nr:tyrosine-type recombinase/integrase [Hyphomicrobiales bacterium]